MKRGKTIFLTHIVLLASICLFSAGQAETAQTGKNQFPGKAIQITVPANPGGDTDMTARFIAKEMEPDLGVSIPIVNMAGAAGALATNDILASPADGYKVLYFHTDTIVSNLLGVSKNRWSDTFEIAAIPSYVENFGMFTTADKPFGDVQSLIAYAKDPNHKKLIYSTDMGSINQVLGRAFQKLTGVEFIEVDGGNASNRVAALLGKQIDLVCLPYSSGAEYVKNGDFKCLGLIASERNSFIPDIPTFKEQGVDLAYNKFFFFGFKKGTPKEIVKRFANAVEKACKSPDYAKNLQKYQMVPHFLDAEAATLFMKERESEYQKYVELAGMTKKQ